MKGGWELKGEGRFFAAGAGFERALAELSDGAFKLFAWVCLGAERASGELAVEGEALARQLGRSGARLERELGELAAKGVCELAAAPGRPGCWRLRVRARYWPYEAVGSGAGQAAAGRVPSRPAAADGAVPGRAAYVRRVREWFRGPTCVQGAFGTEDRQLADRWQREGVPLETVRRAIVLGCTRKSMTLINQAGGQPIRTLHYFQRVLEEVRAGGIPESYWSHLERHLKRCERHWEQHPEHAPGAPRQPGQPVGQAPPARPPAHSGAALEGGGKR